MLNGNTKDGSMNEIKNTTELIHSKDPLGLEICEQYLENILESFSTDMGRPKVKYSN